MPIINISNGTIQEILSERGTTFVTVTYLSGLGNRGNRQTVRLVVRPRTIILNENGNPVPTSALRVGMTINATISSAMTRSIPPQAAAYMIRIIRRPESGSVTVGCVVDVDRMNQSFTTMDCRDFPRELSEAGPMSNRNRSSMIQFHVSEETRFFDRVGRPMNFRNLMPGMRVQVQHANFMTASIPPQTMAFEVRVL